MARGGRSRGAASGARILSAAAIELADIEASFGFSIERWTEVRFDPATAAISATTGRRLGAIRLSSAPDPKPDQAAIEAGMIAAVRRHGLALLPWPETALALRHRAAFAAAHDPAIPALAEEVELVVYRVAQEGLTNVLRHAEASCIEVHLEALGDFGVRLRLLDDGQGLEGAYEGDGIRGMRERAMLVGGDLSVADRSHRGVELRLDVPATPTGDRGERA